MSSAYVNSNKNYAMEKIYDAPANYNDIINYVETMDPDKLNDATKTLVGYFLSLKLIKNFCFQYKFIELLLNVHTFI